MKNNIENLLQKISSPILEKHNFYFIDSEYKKEGSQWYLRLYIDKEGGITINDCQIVSEELNKKLDDLDPIKNSYIFEVSSPGIERPLKKEIDFKRNLTKMIVIKFYKPFMGKKTIEGKLVGYNEDTIKVEYQEKIIEINRALIAIMKPLISF